MWRVVGTLPLFGCPPVACRALSRLLVLEVALSSFFSRVLLSVWVLSPFGRACGSLRAVWCGGSLSVWGGVAPVSVLSVRDAWALCRFFWR